MLWLIKVISGVATLASIASLGVAIWPAKSSDRAARRRAAIRAFAVLGITAMGGAAIGILENSSARDADKNRPTLVSRAVSKEDIEAWNNALANRADCDSLRNYILDNPTGHFINDAQTILGARREITEERWIAFEFPSNVVASSSLESRASREAACASARERMATNMVDGCGVFRDQRSKYRFVKVVPPHDANCECRDEAIPLANAPSNPLWQCSIRAPYSCRGEQLQQVKRVVCN